SRAGAIRPWRGPCQVRAGEPDKARLTAVMVVAALLLLAISGTISAQQTPPAKKLRIAFLYSDGNLPATLRAYRALLKERPDLKDQVAFSFLTESMFDD